MKLNHLNLAVSDLDAASRFLEKHFGLRGMGPGNEAMTGLYDDEGFALVLMKAPHESELRYPRSFHIGFTRPTVEEVNEIHRRLVEDGIAAPAPARMHGAWAFYFNAPGGFRVEVSCW